MRIFEMGLGTGLNALLTLIESGEFNQQIYYEALDPFPLTNDEVKVLNYCSVLNRADLQKTFEQLHDVDWGKEIAISSHFLFKKIKADLLYFQPSATFDLIFFDAFDPNVQPELWSMEIFRKMFLTLLPGGILVTYSSKGAVRRAMQAAGFRVEKIPGPAGKREIVRAFKV